MINKICYLNACSAVELGDIRSHKSSNFNPDFFCESNSYSLWPLMLNLLGNELTNNTRTEVNQILGPLKNNLIFYKEYLYSSDFKYCPECMKKGYHSIFHQLSFLDTCMFHNVPLETRCPYCSNKFEGNYIDIKSRAYNCPHCGRKLFEKPVEIFINDLFCNPLDTSFKIPEHNENDGFICVLNSHVLSNDVKKFLFEYLTEGRTRYIPQCNINKEGIVNSSSKFSWRDEFIIDTINDVLLYYRSSITTEELNTSYRFLNELRSNNQYQYFDTYKKCSPRSLAYILLDELSQQYPYKYLDFENNLSDVIKRIDLAIKNQIGCKTVNDNIYKNVLRSLLDYYLRCCFNKFCSIFEDSVDPKNIFLKKDGKRSFIVPANLCPNVTFIFLQNETEYKIYFF